MVEDVHGPLAPGSERAVFRRELGGIALGLALTIGCAAGTGAKKNKKKKPPHGGGGGAGNGSFNLPRGIAVDGAGHVYGADTENHRIQKFNGNGQFLAAWGTRGNGDGQLTYPPGVAVDASGAVYVVDFSSDRIQKFSPA